MNKIVFIMGYGQKLENNSGLKKLFNKVSNINTSIHEWDVDTSILARKIGAGYSPILDPQLMVVGYSYGGYTAALLAHRLAPMGIDVDYLCMIDPVWRKKEFRASLGSLKKKKKIILPNNVRKIYTWRQSSGRIKGHNVVEGRDSVQYEALMHNRHFKMDDDTEIHRVVMGLAKELGSENEF